MNINRILGELHAEHGPYRPGHHGYRRSEFNWTSERSPTGFNQRTKETWPHERRCPEEAVAAAEAALGAGEDEAEGEGEIGQAGGQVTGGPAGTLST